MTRGKRKSPGRPSAPPPGAPGHGDTVRGLREDPDAWVIEQLPPVEYPEGVINEVERIVPRCESGWTGDRCTLPLGHAGPHSNDGWEDHTR